MSDPRDFSRFMGDVATELLGPPNKKLSSKAELRWGRFGSMSVDIEKGTWYDHEKETGGGVLDLIARQTGCPPNGAAGGAIDWLKERGFDVGDDREDRAPARGKARIVATYDYTDETGDLLFQVCRMEPKTFRQRRKSRPGDDPKKVDRDGFVWSVKGVRLVPYRLPELIEAIAMERTVYIVEGEKDVENLAKIGLPATCNPMGAGKWPESLNPFFAGADVVILPDNDDAGQSHATVVAGALDGIAARVRVLDLPGLPEKGDVSDWIAAGGTVEALQVLAEQATRSPDEAPRRLNFEAVWFADAELAMAEPEWLVDDILTRGDMSLIYGESQSGKSFLATHIAMAIARGEPMLGHKVVRPGGVIYVAAEGKKGFKWRLKAYREHFEITLGTDLPFVLLPVAIDMFAEGEGADYPKLLADIAILAAEMRARGHGLDLIVFDTHAAVSPGANENASEDVSRMMKHYAAAQSVAKGAHLMIVHHKNAGGERPRGHTSLYAGVDNAIEVTNEGGMRTARIAKLKDGQDGSKIGFRLQSVQIGARDDGKPITSCVVVPDEAGAARTGNRARLSDEQFIALQALREALATFGEPAPGALQLPHGLRIVRAEHWKRELLKRGFYDDLSEGAFRTAFSRVGKALMTRGVIGRDQPYVWIVREPSA